MSISVMLVEDHRIVRKGLRSLLEMQKDIIVVGEADNGRDAVILAERLSPRIIVMDIAMPGMNGIDATGRILEKCPKTRVLALTMHDDRHSVLRAIKAGASGYLLKDCSCRELLRCIRAVAAGKTCFGSEIADHLAGEYATSSRNKTTEWGGLTKREKEVLQLLAEGNNSHRIASILSVHERTIDVHRHNIMNKLNIRSVAGLTKYAVREGLTSL